MDNIQKTIDLILNTRDSKRTSISNLVTNIDNLKDSLEDFKSLKYHLKEKHNEEFNNLNLDEITFDIEKLSSEASKMSKRFARDRINIAVVGEARQGKSRLLQSISGLTRVEIPDGNGQHCTGVKSIIKNTKDTLKEAEVHFFSEETFLERFFYHILEN